MPPGVIINIDGIFSEFRGGMCPSVIIITPSTFNSLAASNPNCKSVPPPPEILRLFKSNFEPVKLNRNCSITSPPTIQSSLHRFFNLLISPSEIKAAFRTKNSKSLTDKETPKEIVKLINEGHLEEGIFEVGDLDLKAIRSMRIYKDSRLGIFRDLEEEEYRYVCELVTEQSS